MSLRVRLSILITLLFLSVFIVAGSYVISNARRAVVAEITSTASHTLQLVEVMLDSVENIGEAGIQNLVLENMSRLSATRHLQIVMQQKTGGIQPFPPGARPRIDSEAPDWFTELVKPPPLEFRRIVSLAKMPGMEIIIHADPSDEITEVWYETRSVLFFLLLFIILANLLLYVALGRYLAPIASILDALERIEHGDYQLRLPQYPLPELSRISDRVNHMADVLLASRNENRRLAQMALAIQEQERHHLARELHDELGQSLSAIKALAASIGQQAGADKTSIRESALTIGSFSERMYEVARNMMQRLRPTVLDELGLLVALQEMIDDWNQRHGDIFCHFQHTGDIDSLGDKINIHLYRIIQESLTNVVKHAEAGEVSVNLAVKGGDLKLEIRDDGGGVRHDSLYHGLGLSGMQERVEAMNGKIDISSEPGSGVTISIVIPLLE